MANDRTAVAGSVDNPPQGQQKAEVIKILPRATTERWDGWGTSLCWMGKAFGNRDDLADLLFTMGQVRLQDWRVFPGLGLNIVRYNAGACSWNTFDGKRMVIPPKTNTHYQMEGFWLDGKSTDPSSTSWNWSVDANQRAMLLKARDRGATSFELFSNSPMWWMCSNLNPSGDANGGNNLDPAHDRNFAIYLATIARHARDYWGIAFDSVEAFNEPTGNWWKGDGRQEGCHISSERQAKIIPLLRAELDKRGLRKTIIAASDECMYYQALDTWKSFDNSVKVQVGRFNLHGYQYEQGPRVEVRKVVTDKRIWNTEYGDKDMDGLVMAQCIGLDMQYLNVNAWCYWQPLDDVRGWALIHCRMADKTLLEVNPKYFVLAHYTRHIRPGMIILPTGNSETVAAYDDKTSKLVLVLLNRGAARERCCDLSSLKTVDGPSVSWTTETKGSDHYKLSGEIKMDGKLLRVRLPEKSVRTIEISGVRP